MVEWHGLCHLDRAFLWFSPYVRSTLVADQAYRAHAI